MTTIQKFSAGDLVSLHGRTLFYLVGVRASSHCPGLWATTGHQKCIPAGIHFCLIAPYPDEDLTLQWILLYEENLMLIERPMLEKYGKLCLLGNVSDLSPPKS